MRGCQVRRVEGVNRRILDSGQRRVGGLQHSLSCRSRVGRARLRTPMWEVEGCLVHSRSVCYRRGPAMTGLGCFGNLPTQPVRWSSRVIRLERFPSSGGIRPLRQDTVLGKRGRSEVLPSAKPNLRGYLIPMVFFRSTDCLGGGELQAWQDWRVPRVSPRSTYCYQGSMSVEIAQLRRSPDSWLRSRPSHSRFERLPSSGGRSPLKRLPVEFKQYQAGEVAQVRRYLRSQMIASKVQLSYAAFGVYGDAVPCPNGRVGQPVVAIVPVGAIRGVVEGN